MIHYVEGDTEAIVMQLLSNGVPPAQPLTGDLLLTVLDAGGRSIDTTGKTSVVDPDTWTVAYTPAAGDLVETGRVHRYHWTVDQGGVEFSFPGGPADGIDVSRRGGGRLHYPPG
jgi:hypothetical protein